uniref:GATA transcription factor 8-like n=1 Tax=Erigeron canadensis TaxID=72917 RepID=UPI001CB93C18|nr:GATA transcription factor 8-like [Erigeron canadensis]
MASQDYIEEIDCASFFDHIDDFIDFPPVNDTPLDSCNDFPSIWTNTSSDLQVSTNSVFIGNKGDNTLPAEISVPYEDVQLEWLSNFVEDSFSGGGMTINKEKVEVPKETVVMHHHFQTSSPVSVLESSSSSSSSSSYSTGGAGNGMMIPLSPIQRGPQRARSKRPRPPTFNPRAMIELLSPLVFVPVSAHPESENNFTSRCGPIAVDCVPEEKKKKKTKKPKVEWIPVEENENQNENQNQSGQGVRKCMHCEITKTPQWRAGPMGPKSLCNACGVRYKSGRLFPEYRPAASPTFVPTLHSNSHKKVVEMRTKFGPNDILAITKTKPEPVLIPNINHGVGYI